MIPRDGQVTLGQVAEMVSSAPIELGIPDTAEVRTVLVLHSDGEWVNHITVLRLGTSVQPPRMELQELPIGAAKLTGLEFSAASIQGQANLIDVLTSWQSLLAAEGSPDPGQEKKATKTSVFQQPVNGYHHGSSNKLDAFPCWALDLYDTQHGIRDFSAPIGPFKNLESGFYAEDIGAAAKIWTADPTFSGTTVRNAYRIIIPDKRGYIKERVLHGNRLSFSVEGTKADNITCALTTHPGERRELKPVVNGRVEFVLNEPTSNWEVYLFDTSEAWCDHYYHYATVPSVASPVFSVAELDQGGDSERSLLEKVESLQNLTVMHATGKAANEEEYQRLRRELLAEDSISKQLPRFIRTCRDLSQFWAFIQPKFKTYKERREYLWKGFRTVLDTLEGKGQSPADQPVSEALKNFAPDAVHEAWRRALDRRLTDPEGAVTMARTLLETVCKHILEEAKVEFPDDADLPTLYRLTATKLNVAPSQHTEKVFKQILGGATAVVEGLGALRNKLGDAHGRGKQPPKPAPRHAQLAVNLAGALATFLVETWQANLGQAS